MTSHNRRDLTMASLRAVHNQGFPVHEIVLVDAGSSDGTAASVENEFPAVHVIREGPHLYWSSGMRRAMEEARGLDVEAYLWLNDDTILQDDAVEVLVRTHAELTRRNPTRLHVVVGTTVEPGSSRVTYGGLVSWSRWRPLKLSRVQPLSRPVACDTFNGNIVLLPRIAVDLVGPIDSCWFHAMGDVDYGFKLSRNGVRLSVAPGVLGSCPTNSARGTWTDQSLPFKIRWRLLCDVKGLPPRQYTRLCRRWGGPFWPAVAAKPAFSVIMGAGARGVRRPGWTRKRG